MHDPTKPIPSPLSGNLPARRRGESERLAAGAGSGKGVSRASGGVVCIAYSGNEAVE